MQEHSARQAGPGKKVPGGGAGRGGDGHDWLELHLRGGAQVRRAGEHHPQLDGRRSWEAGQRICQSQSGGGAGDRGAGGAGGEGADRILTAAGGREPESCRGAGKAAPETGRGCAGTGLCAGQPVEKRGRGAGGRDRGGACGICKPGQLRPAAGRGCAQGAGTAAGAVRQHDHER